MHNIWRYSLVLAFSIIFDQLVKGTMQGFLASDFEKSYLGFVAIKMHQGVLLPEVVNTTLCVLYVVIAFLVLKSIVHGRHKSFIMGMWKTFVLTGLSSSFLDRASLGRIIDYIIIGPVSFNMSTLMLITGLVGMIGHYLLEKKTNVAHSL